MPHKNQGRQTIIKKCRGEWFGLPTDASMDSDGELGSENNAVLFASPVKRKRAKVNQM